jgi:hypothetical protein
MWGRHTVSELEVRTLSHLRDMDLKMLMIDEVHNLLAGSYREKRRFLNMLRFLANDLCASLVVFGGFVAQIVLCRIHCMNPV